MDKGFLAGRKRLNSIKRRLADELERELPPGIEDGLGKILDAAVNFHQKDQPTDVVGHFDFRAISGEGLLPTGDDSFGAADFLKFSQVIERSLVGLISSADLPSEEKTRFTNDVQAFFDNFDTALLSQLEDELTASGLLRPVAAPPEPLEEIFEALGYSKDLADEMADPVLVTSGDDIIYTNSAAVSILGNDALRGPAYGQGGLLSDYIMPGTTFEREWTRRWVELPTAKGEKTGALAVWKTVDTGSEQLTLIILTTSGKQPTSRSRVDVLTREKRRFKVLYRLSKELLCGYDIEDMLSRLSKELSAGMQFDAMLLHLNYNQHNRALFHLISPLSREPLEAMLDSSLSTLTAFVPDANLRMINQRTLNPNLLDENLKFKKDKGNIFILPLIFGEEVFGTLGFYRISGLPVSDEDLHLFSTFCNQFTLALKNTIAIEDMRKLLRDNREQIELARRVQLGLLPKPYEFKRLKFCTLFQAAAGLSGDFYHFFTNSTAEGLVIGDASGHGLSASLIMAAAGATFRDVCTRPVCKPDEALLKANGVLKQALGEDYFVVALVFVIDPETLQAKYTSAGHPAPFLLKKDGRVRLLSASGLPLGMFDDPGPYQVHNVKLESGDRLLFFTDGAIENRNVKGELFGLKRLRKALKKSIHLQGDELLAAIAGDISSFLDNLENADDMTLVLMEVE